MRVTSLGQRITVGERTRMGTELLTRDQLGRYICAKFCEVVRLSEAEVLGANLTLRQVVSVAPGMTNSVDLMEAFAKTANALRKEHALKVRLPTFPLDSTASSVLDAFLAEAEKE